MEHTKHIWRAVILIAILGTLGIVIRHFMIPESFGDEGFYRADSRLEYMAKPVIYGTSTSCQPCHAEQFDAKAEGKHAAVQCDVCHTPLTPHVKDDKKIADMQANLSHRLCAYCHQKLRARPESISQVDIRAHLELTLGQEIPEEIPEGVCVVCHDVHNPTLE